MKLLSVESSCDETAVAIVEDGRHILTDCIASQVALHRLYGGVVPELASRKHIEAIYALADEALAQAQLTRQDIDAIAVTYAPGLIGAVLVGVNFAKAAAYSLGVPLVPVHHIRGHIAANYLAYPDLEPPFLCLVVSGGHTVYSDEKWVRFILNQLIANAVKYRMEQPVLRISTHKRQDQVVLVVEDNGIGIAASDLPRIFEKGFTGQNGRMVQQSTGIGLYLCKRLCEKLGIGIMAESSEHGTAISLSFHINCLIHEVQS